MHQYKPLRKNKLILKELRDEFLIYSSERKELHVINPTAQLIWDFCDGEHSLADIENEMRMRFSIPADRDLTGDIQNALTIFRDKGLLENEEAPGN